MRQDTKARPGLLLSRGHRTRYICTSYAGLQGIVSVRVVIAFTVTVVMTDLVAFRDAIAVIVCVGVGMERPGSQ